VSMMAFCSRPSHKTPEFEGGDSRYASTSRTKVSCISSKPERSRRYCIPVASNLMEKSAIIPGCLGIPTSRHLQVRHCMSCAPLSGTPGFLADVRVHKRPTRNIAMIQGFYQSIICTQLRAHEVSSLSPFIL
jgi:hypothetical protein